MEMSFSILCLVIILNVVTVSETKERNNKPYKVVCYWSSWSYYRKGKGEFKENNFDPNLCTHIIYAFTKLNQNNTIGVFDPNLDTQGGMYKYVNNLRKKNPNLTTMIAIGGWGEGSDKYSKMARNKANRKTFIKSVLAFLKKYDFDGLDLDWEYPGFSAKADSDRKPGYARDKKNFIYLIRELRTAFKANKYVLSAAVGAGKNTVDLAYDIKQMNKYMDFINLMTYDFHGGWEPKTGHNSPLFAGPGDEKMLTVNYAVNYWIKLGVSPKKLVLGLPFYGRTFKLKSVKNHKFNAPTAGTGKAGPYTSQSGYLNYNEICTKLKSKKWRVIRDKKRQVPYAVRGVQWIGFDDPKSISRKVRFAKKKGLGGAMVWSIDGDDLTGGCGKGKYPLLNAINKSIK